MSTETNTTQSASTETVGSASNDAVAGSKTTYIVHNKTDTTIFWWVGAWPSPIVLPGNRSSTFDYEGGPAWFRVINDENKKTIAHIAFPSSGQIKIELRGTDNYLVTPA